jgi:undecaprenyl-diphosphatase
MGVVVVHVWAGTVRRGVDVPLNRYFFHHRDRHLTALFRLVSLAGEESVTLAATVVAGLAWGRWRRSWLPFPALAVAFGGGTVIAAAVKVAVGRGRPAGAPFLALSHLGFPSGHATVAAALYGTWAVLIARSPIRPRVRALSVAGLAGLALAVAFSRLYLGRHYLTDVVAGVVLGGIWAWSVNGVAHRRRRARR